MIYSDSATVAILLCTNLGIEGEYKPLTLKEWNGLGKTVNDRGYKIADLLKSEFIEKLPISEKQKEQIKLLTGRGFCIALKLQELENKGIYIVTQFDSDYPKYLKRKLREKMPPVLFYAGDITLAGKIGIAIVGSRDVDDAGMLFAKDLAKKATKEKLIIYSGGAKGVDSISEKAAIDEGGYVLSFIGDSLSKKIRNKDVIKNILNKRILLFSDVNPDTGFSVGRAMNRNKFIYAAAHGAFVVSSDFGKGGTWTGAVENINNSWTKLFVWNGCVKKGNKVQLTYNPGRIGNNDEIWVDVRKPVIAQFEFKGKNIFVLANHLKSKRSDDKVYGTSHPVVRKSEEVRNPEGKQINNFVKSILKNDPKSTVIVLGDMNDFEFSRR